ncbi:MAG TPA: alpha-xylosidase, partial [Mobilitalea sp.]|nr:alpha-xylosidase [Mobilitalea sp.]
EFTADPICAYLDKQYMLGDSLLVAPVFNDEGIVNYYLPEGRWTDYFTGDVKTGSRYIKEKHGYLSIPLLVKEGSIIAVGNMDDNAEYDYSDGIILKAYELIDQVPTSTVVYNGKAQSEVKAEIIKKDSEVYINVESEHPYTVVLVNVTNIASVENGSYEIKGHDTIIMPFGKGEIICKLN